MQGMPLILRLKKQLFEKMNSEIGRKQPISKNNKNVKTEEKIIDKKRLLWPFYGLIAMQLKKNKYY